MTDKELSAVINLKSTIERYEEIVSTLLRYKSDVKTNTGNILDYFCTYPLFDPSLHQTLENLLNREIIAGQECINKAKATFLKL